MRKVGLKRRAIPWMGISVVIACLLLAQTRELERLRVEVTRLSTYSFPEKFRFETPYFGLTYAGESGIFIDDRILQYGAFEKPELFLLEKLVGQRKNVVFLDVGANSGTYSLFMSRVAEKVYAVEPFPPALAKLRHNLEINHLTNVEVHPVGFGREKGQLPFYAPPTINLGVGSFSEEFANIWRDPAATRDADQQLPLEIGDHYLQQRGIERVDIVKVDIEGYEKYALQGLRQTLLQSRPCVLMELNMKNAEGFRSLQDLKGVFPPGYRLYQVVSSLSDLRTGAYVLKEMSRVPEAVEKGREQINVLGVPEEQALTM